MESIDQILLSYLASYLNLEIPQYLLAMMRFLSSICFMMSSLEEVRRKYKFQDQQRKFLKDYGIKTTSPLILKVGIFL